VSFMGTTENKYQASDPRRPSSNQMINFNIPTH